MGVVGGELRYLNDGTIGVNTQQRSCLLLLSILRPTVVSITPAEEPVMRKTLSIIALAFGLIFAGAPAFADTYLDQPICRSVNDTPAGSPCVASYPALDGQSTPSYLDQPLCHSAADNFGGTPCVVGEQQAHAAHGKHLRRHAHRHH
jgi:hypothetical protein